MPHRSNLEPTLQVVPDLNCFGSADVAARNRYVRR